MHVPSTGVASMTASIKVVGVLGGMGPDATIDFMAKVVAGTPANADQDHVRMLVDHNPRVPARILGDATRRSEIEEALAQMASGLERNGADFLVMPCNAAHNFIDRAVRETSIPFVHLIHETVRETRAVAPKARRVGLLAVDTSIRAGLYQAAVESAGMTMLVPDAANQRDVMRLIIQVKQGQRGKNIRDGMALIANALISEGADVIIAGCTEIPLVLSNDDITVPLIASTDVLAARTVEWCLGLKPLPDN